MTGSALPLAGVVVADFTRILSGPTATLALADMGAEVIKIERPPAGDDTRIWGPPFVGDTAAYFFSVNRNKKSIALDLKNEDDREIAREIVARADVLVENFRPGVMDRLGLGHGTLSLTNPDLVYCSIPAFTTGEERDLPGYDLTMQAISGFMSITGEEDGPPVKMGAALLDVIAGLHAAAVICAALRAREAGSGGSHVEVGLFDASVSALINQASNFLVGGVVPVPMGSAHPNIVPYQAFPARDGHFVLAAATDNQFDAACSAIGRPDLARDERFRTNASRIANRQALIVALEDTFSGGDVSDWVEALMAAGVPAGPIRSIDQVFESPEGSARVALVADDELGEIRLARGPVTVDGRGVEPTAPPRLDSDRQSILDWVAATAAKS